MTIVPKTKQEVCTVLRYRDKKENERALRKRLKRGLAEGRQKSGGFEEQNLFSGGPKQQYLKRQIRRSRPCLGDL